MGLFQHQPHQAGNGFLGELDSGAVVRGEQLHGRGHRKIGQLFDLNEDLLIILPH